ncbi:MAG: HAMP domain-containing sensor histidine kinase [Acidobacteriota bacterium]|nr:HAMP domain-containing sensor histidine kinase [Acidobacteriota bacterium]
MTPEVPSGQPGNGFNHRARRIIWIVSLAVFLPLVIMVSLQYFWLTDLKETSAFARRARLAGYLKHINEDIGYSYWKPAKLLLESVEANMFTKSPKKLERYYKKRSVPVGEKVGKKMYKYVKGARYFFHISYVSENPDLYVFDVEAQQMMSPENLPHDTARALDMIQIFYNQLHYKKKKPENPGFRETQDNPDQPIIFASVVGEEGYLAGIMGLVLNMDYLENVVLRNVIHTIPQSEFDDVNIRVYDREKKLVMSEGYKGRVEKGDEVATAYIQYAFKGWEMKMTGRASINDWADTNFMFNIILSLVLALVLAAGILFALRTASRELQVSEMKSDFVSNVSHELRTPLASIRVFGEMLRLGRAESEEKVREYGEFIETESRRLTQLINNILDFSKIESGRKQYHFETTDPRDVLTRVLKVFEVRAQSGGIPVRYCDRGAPAGMMNIDPDALGQAVFNLVDNGIKYGEKGDSVDVSLHEENDYLVISVKDYGVGIPREELDKIFDRFHRVNTGLVHDVKGSGLGLSIVKHVAEAHGGSVRVESEIGKGSTFSLWLPLKSPSGGVPAAEAEPA